MKKIEKVKQHFRNNKKLYVGLGVGVAVGATTAYVLRPKTDMQVNNKIQQILSWKPKATLEVHIEALGDPGNIIQDLTTGTIYASQRQAARELGVNPARITEHLQGKHADVKGHVLEFLGKAHVSQ